MRKWMTVLALLVGACGDGGVPGLDAGPGGSDAGAPDAFEPANDPRPTCLGEVMICRDADGRDLTERGWVPVCTGYDEDVDAWMTFVCPDSADRGLCRVDHGLDRLFEYEAGCALME